MTMNCRSTPELVMVLSGVFPVVSFGHVPPVYFGGSGACVAPAGGSSEQVVNAEPTRPASPACGRPVPGSSELPQAAHQLIANQHETIALNAAASFKMTSAAS